jgi:Immunity protein 8
MKVVLKSIFTFRGAFLTEFVPDIPQNFYLSIDMTIGPDNQAGGHDYSLGVCTPRWLNHNVQKEGSIWGRHLLVVNHYDAQEIRAAIEKMIDQCERSDWAQTSVVLSRFFSWEFEDYAAK